MTNVNIKVSDELRSQSIDICFRDISYNIQIQDTSEKQSIVPCLKTHKEKKLLDHLTGIMPAGKLTAIMGASGAGKTTLLNVLAARINPNKVDGSITANTSKYSFENFGDFANYVMQKDVLIETLTVRQTLEFAANLKLDLSKEQKKQKINTLVQKFKLEKCLDTVVGGNILKGISGGQKKRTSIAFQLISDPAVVMLDEPTSGLDSLTSFIIVYHLKQLTLKKGKTVIMTIHQPNSQIYQLFDRLILMVQGKLIYQGDAAQAPSYFSNNFGLKVGDFVNPADYFMSIMHHESPQNVQRYPRYFEAYEKHLVPQITRMLQQERSDPIQKRQVDVPFCTSLGVLVERDFLNTIRNPMLLRSRIVSTIFLSIYTSGLYYQFTGEYTSTLNWRALTGFLFFIGITSLMSALAPIVLVFPTERAVFLKEQGSKLYPTSSYFLSRNIIQIPMSFIFPLISSLIMYWFVGLSSTVGQFFTYYLIAYLVGFSGTSLGLLLGSLIHDQKSVSVAMPIVLLPFILFSGFFKNTGNLSSWFGWIQYISPIKYSFSSWIQNEVVNASISNVGLLNLDVGLWLGVGILVVLAVSFRMLGLLFLWLLRSKLE